MKLRRHILTPFVAVVALTGCLATPSPDMAAQRKELAALLNQAQDELAVDTAELQRFRQENHVSEIANSLDGEREKLEQLQQAAANAAAARKVAEANAQRVRGSQAGAVGMPDLADAQAGDAQVRALLTKKLALEMARDLAVKNNAGTVELQAMDGEMKGVEKKLEERRSIVDNETLRRYTNAADALAAAAAQRMEALSQQADAQAARIEEMERILDEDQNQDQELSIKRRRVEALRIRLGK